MKSLKKTELELDKVKSLISNLRGVYNTLSDSKLNTEFIKYSVSLLKHSIEQLTFHKLKMERDLKDEI